MYMIYIKYFVVKNVLSIIIFIFVLYVMLGDNLRFENLFWYYLLDINYKILFIKLYKNNRK